MPHPCPFAMNIREAIRWSTMSLAQALMTAPPLSVKIFPNIGAKSTGLCFDHQPYELSGEIWDPYLYLSAPWGSYIPYPTPNRVRDSAFIFHGERVLMKKFGHLRDSHGLAYDSRWQYDEPVLSEGGVAMRLWLEMQPGDENFPAFPYRNRLTVEYRITERCLSFSYRVDNLDERPMPYGLCKHPFFMRADPKEPILIKVEADSVYETTPELLPTGRFCRLQTIQNLICAAFAVWTKFAWTMCIRTCTATVFIFAILCGAVSFASGCPRIFKTSLSLQ